MRRENAFTWFAATATAALLLSSSSQAQEQQPPFVPSPASQASGGLGITFLGAVIAEDGSHGALDGAGVLSSQNLSTGTYEVIFRRNIKRCFWSGTIGDRDDGVVPSGTIGLDLRTGTVNGIFISTRDATGVLANRPFHLSLFCNG